MQVSNELLEEAFSQFGQVERAVVVVDDKGRSLGRGIVEFARKSSATKALAQIRVLYYFNFCQFASRFYILSSSCVFHKH